MRTALALVAALAAFVPGAACPGQDGASPRVLGVSQLIQEVRQHGRVTGRVHVTGDLNLGLLEPPEGAAPRPIAFDGVSFRGRLFGAPRHPMRFSGGSICTLTADGNEWTRSVELRRVGLSRVSLRRSKIGGDFTCLGCTICRASFEDALFGGEATFTSTHFGRRDADDICERPAPSGCGTTDFSEAVFAATARFDRATFESRGAFDGVEFRASARFPGVVAKEPLSFVGARMRGSVDFRDCHLSALYFGTGFGDGAVSSYEATETSALADFRRCTFAGPVRFDGAVFLGEALFSPATFAGDTVSFLGAVSSRQIDIRGARFLHPQARLLLDARAGDALHFAWDELSPVVLRGAAKMDGRERSAMFHALSRRLEAQGAARSARVAAFEAERGRRAEREQWCDDGSLGACLGREAEWWLWTLPTRNSGDPAVPITALFGLWLLLVAAGMAPGRVLVLSRADEDAGSAYSMAGEAAAGAYCPVGFARLRESATLANQLVFKLGSARSRFAAPESAAMRDGARVALWAVWLLGWVLLAAVAAVVAAAFPGLRFLFSG